MTVKKLAPLVVHLTYRLDFGGLEMLMVECINRIPADRYRHAVICLTDYTDFAKKITRPDVELFSLHKPPGLAARTHLDLWRLLRRLKPTILHTYNLAAIEYALPALLANVPVRVHGEHGRDARDPDGTNRRHNQLRKLMLPLYDCYYAISGDLHNWLKNVIGVPDQKNLLLGNGIDTDKFHPANTTDAAAAVPTTAIAPDAASHGFPADCIVFGTVGRIQDVKDHAGLVDAFLLLLDAFPERRAQLRLAIVGDGPLLRELKQKVAGAGIADLVWLPGMQTDIAGIMRRFSAFVLSSLAEGTPVTILEAMATALPVVSTNVGGIPEAVIDNATGLLVPPSDPQALAEAMAQYVRQPALAMRHGLAGKKRIKEHYSMATMLEAYAGMYDAMIVNKKRRLGGR